MFRISVRLFNRTKQKYISPVNVNLFYTTAMTNNYEDAVHKINSLQSNTAYIRNAVNQGIIPHSAIYSTTIAETQKYLLRTGITLEQLDKLSVIHVAGTKGKGSTCAFCESILRQYGFKTGFYSSPHLVAVRERIKIDGKPLSKEIFAQNVFLIYNQLYKNQDYTNDMPAYFRFLTVLAYNIFIAQKVDVAIIEVGIGGEYDCTNIVRTTPIAGITSLGIDHVSMLGNTIEQIAWQKAGIMKKHSKVFTVAQPENAMNVLKQRSIEKECLLTVVPNFDSYKWTNQKPILGINGDVQKINASLAIQLTSNWIKYCGKINNTNLLNSLNLLKDKLIVPDKIEIGLAKCKWPGRNQILKNLLTTYYLDGAHTTDSLEICSKWFKNEISRNENRYKALIFNITGGRSAEDLLQKLIDINLDQVMFVPNIANSKSPADQKNLSNTEDEQIKQCENHKNTWLKLEKLNNIGSNKNRKILVLPSVEDAIINLPNNQKCDVLITGSLHLVGAALNILDPDLKTF